MRKLIVAETFYSLQCEGREIGVPAVFLRLGGCNLLCNAAWICDSIEVWKKGKSTPFSEVLCEDHLQRLRNGAHLVITGGEPLLQQNKIEEYLEYLYFTHKLRPVIEIETNGTLYPIPYLVNKVSRWNVSPKLANSGEPVNKRLNEGAIQILNNLEETIFKFVINEESDVLEILQDFDIDMSKLVFMPAGSSREELEQTRMIAVQQALKLGVRYSDRLHIVIWNQKTGV